MILSILLLVCHIKYDGKNGCIGDIIFEEYNMKTDEFNVTDYFSITLPDISNSTYYYYLNKDIGRMKDEKIEELNLNEYPIEVPKLCADSSFELLLSSLFRTDILPIYLMNTFHNSGAIRVKNELWDIWNEYKKFVYNYIYIGLILILIIFYFILYHLF